MEVPAEERGPVAGEQDSIAEPAAGLNKIGFAEAEHTPPVLIAPGYHPTRAHFEH